jgi:DNA-binding response OmpR family regulator
MLILDVIMPKKNGKAVFEEIRKLDPGVAVLFISGYTDDIIDSDGIVNNQWDFLAKPLSLYSLLRKVRQILDRPAANNS